MLRALFLAVAVAMLPGCDMGRDDALRNARDRTPPRVLYVEEVTFAADGRDSLASLRRQTARLLPQESIEWTYMTVDPADADALLAAIAVQRPSVVIFANDALVDGLAGRKVDVPMLASSSRDASALARRFATFRRENEIALVSWQATDEVRALDTLARIRGAPVRSVAAFADRDRIEAGVLDRLEALAKQRDIAFDVNEYEAFDQFSQVFERRMASAPPEAVFLPITHHLLVHVEEAPRIPLRHRTPAIYTRGDQVAAGGLLSYDAPDGEVNVQLARYLVLLLFGAKASSLPIAVPTRTQLAINLGAADALGYTVPYEVLVEAGEIHR